MVMATPSPECVGREFVRQYYTLLNEAPLHLHRFYSNNSSFLHGGVEHEEPVIGQAAIHKKIMSLNFRDCHAKIRQVDSHATLSAGVVVQVTGELSNNGQPMRRFMQTFVLAPQSPKKYYVHNDIFRYQDEVFNDDEETENLEGSPVESEGEVEDETTLDSAQNTVEDVQEQTVPSFYHASPVSNGTVEEIPQPVQDVIKPLEAEEIIEKPEAPTQPAPSSPMAPEIEPSPPSPPQQQPEEQQTITPVENVIENHTGSPTPGKDELLEQETPKTLSWADRARQHTLSNMPIIGTPSPVVVKQSPTQQPSSPPSKEQNKMSEPVGVRSDPLPQRMPRQSGRGMGRGIPPSGPPGGGGGGPNDGGMSEQPMRPRPRYPDSHQVFVGNLPHDINEEELKNHFMEYGNVVEMRINTKSSGGKIPNFGFIVFDDPSPVQTILGAKPIRFRGDHRLNVEEKKARIPRGPDMRGNKIDSRPMGPGRGGLGGPQGGGRGGGGRGSGLGGGINKGGSGGGNRFNPRRN